MSDLEQMKAMLKRAGKDYSISGEVEAQASKTIVIEVQNDRVGYAGFSTEFIFNLDGSLKDIAAWE